MTDIDTDIDIDIITPEILYDLAYGYSDFKDTWYLYIISNLTELNLPEEIPKIVHFVLIQQLYEFDKDLEKDLILKIAKDCIISSKKYSELFKNGNGEEELPDLEIPNITQGLKYHTEKEIIKKQMEIIDLIREMLLKISMFVGMPKSINSFMILISNIPKNLFSLGYKRNAITKENSNGIDTINGKISQDSIHINSIMNDLFKGSEYFKDFYGDENSNDMRKNLISISSDLWYFINNHLYSSLLSFNDILDYKQTSLILISCIIPQDIPNSHIIEQYYQSAINFGSTIEELDNLKQLVSNFNQFIKSQ